MKDFIVDASVVAKWFWAEADSDKARLLSDAGYYLRAPDLLIPEVSNVFWKRAIRGEMTSAEVRFAVDILLKHHIDVTVRLVPSRILSVQAIRIAESERRSVYDSLYLALAVQARCRLVTADDRFAGSIRNPLLKQHIVSLSDPQFLA